jgi:hypothetical protein
MVGETDGEAIETAAAPDIRLPAASYCSGSEADQHFMFDL